MKAIKMESIKLNNTSDFKTALKEAKSLYINKQFEKAKQVLHPFIIENNNDYRIYSLLGLIYHKEGSFYKAINNYQKAINLNKNDFESYLNLSLIYNDLGKYEDALKYYKEAYSYFNNKKEASHSQNQEEIDTMFSKQHHKTAELYLRYNRLEEALFEFQKAKKLDERNYELDISMAEIYYRLKNKKTAFKLLYGLKLKANIKAMLKLGYLHYLDANYVEATIEWDEVLNKEPDNIDAKMFKKMLETNTLNSLN